MFLVLSTFSASLLSFSQLYISKYSEPDSGLEISSTLYLFVIHYWPTEYLHFTLQHTQIALYMYRECVGTGGISCQQIAEYFSILCFTYKFMYHKLYRFIEVNAWLASGNYSSLIFNSFLFGYVINIHSYETFFLNVRVIHYIY